MKQFTMGAVVNTINNSTLLENYYVTKDEKTLKENFQTWLECF